MGYGYPVGIRGVGYPALGLEAETCSDLRVCGWYPRPDSNRRHHLERVGS
jgi:hypothetical protein